MSEATKIEWADATFNPWIGCTKVSPGCVHCYAERETRPRVLRSRGQETWGKGKPRVRTSEATWQQVRRWNREAARWGECWRCGRVGVMPAAGDECPSCGNVNTHHAHRAIDGAPVRMRVFPSMCDPFDAEVPVEWLADYLRLIFETPNLDHLLLTKRPEKALDRLLLAANELSGPLEDGPLPPVCAARWVLDWLRGYPPCNVWMGTSVEDQVRADERIPALLKIPARVRFLSVEPLLGEVDLQLGRVDIMGKEWDGGGDMHKICLARNREIHWVIVGGESGPAARPCAVEWVRALKEQCQTAGVPVFVKQLGKVAVSREVVFDTDRGIDGVTKEHPLALKHPKGGDMSEWPEDLRVREFPVVK